MEEKKESQIKTNSQSGGVNIGAGSHVEVAGDLVGRDKITVGAGAENVAINSRFIFQNNVRIGKLVIPARLILALLGVAVAIAAAAWYVIVPAQMPVYTFNVAVAEFGQLDAQGNLHASADGSKLSEWMFGRLEEDTQNLPQGLQLTLWHDSLGWLRKRTTIGIVPDAAAAARLAKQINAQVVIYGNLEANQNPATFTPTFYVRNLKGEADEIVGSQQLGSALAVQLPLDFNDARLSAYLDKNLAPRVSALLWFTGGLADDLIGDYGKAYQVFKQADGQLTNWPENEGKEVLYYFLGREALFSAQDATVARQVFGSPDQALDEAEKEFTRAKTINSQYARAYFGLGQVEFQRAQNIVVAQPSDKAQLDHARDLLNQAIQYHQQALKLAPQSPGSEIEIKTEAALGASYSLYGESLVVGGDPGAADPHFKQAVAEFDALLPRIPPQDYRTVAETHLALGAALDEQAQARLMLQDRAGGKSLFEEAVQEYQKCGAQADAFAYDSFLVDLKNKHCLPNQVAVQQALGDLK
jgi:tetratricopeptide (TPR) repeat protein